MEFQFNINRVLPNRINKITENLVSESFNGDKRDYNECQRLLVRIIDDMGEASAKAQGLSKPITSAAKLRDTDHIVYLLVDNESDSSMGSVIGLLKTGSKNLFLYNEQGRYFQVHPRCILDFYIHETRQRRGLGLELYQHMLAEEHEHPVKLAIDCPSDKLLAFLAKHYDLTRTIPQSNKFTVFRGFFDDELEENNCDSRYGPTNKVGKGRVSPPAVSHSSYGRFRSSQPTCSMGDIIGNTAVNHAQPPSEHSGEVQPRKKRAPRPRSLSLYSDEEQILRSSDDMTVSTPMAPEEQSTSLIPFLLNADNVDNANSTLFCTLEMGGGKQKCLDLKFYHSPLW